MFIFCSKKYSNVKSYIFHHIVTLGLLYFSWMLNAHRAGTLLIVINNNVIYLFLSIAKILRLMEKKNLAFISFWVFFVVRNYAKVLFLRIAYISFFKTGLPFYPAHLLMNSFILMLIIHNVYFTLVLCQMARKHTKGTLDSETHCSTQEKFKPSAGALSSKYGLVPACPIEYENSEFVNK